MDVFSRKAFNHRRALIEPGVRSGLIWKLFMSNPDIQAGLKKLGFKSKWMKE